MIVVAEKSALESVVVVEFVESVAVTIEEEEYLISVVFEAFGKQVFAVLAESEVVIEEHVVVIDSVVVIVVAAVMSVAEIAELVSVAFVVSVSVVFVFVVEVSALFVVVEAVFVAIVGVELDRHEVAFLEVFVVVECIYIGYQFDVVELVAAVFELDYY